MSLASLDLRARPGHRSELKSQLLLGEIVEPLAASPDGLWWRVRNAADGYEGWARTWGLVPCTRARARRWQERARGRIVVAHVEARTERGGGTLVSPLFWNSRVILGPAKKGWRHAELPDGRRGWIPAAAAPAGPHSVDLVGRVRDLLGIPYLWGGRTPAGFDCSALVQQLLAEQGIPLPRDAHDQYRTARPLEAGEPSQPGDLAGFGTARGRIAHIGLLLGGGLYVHARGQVRLQSLDLANPLCDRELLAQLRGIRRPESAARTGTRIG